jgi:transcriptional regulator NrdR family protein
MVCINCGNKTQVTNSRAQKRVNQVWRRRSCAICGITFTTIETADYGQSWQILATNGSFSSFSRDRLFLSILNSLKHRRGTAIADAGGLADTIMAKLAPQVIDGQINSQSIIQTTQVALNRFDSAASMHYHAFHKLT